MVKIKKENILQTAEKIYLSNDNSKLLEYLNKHISKYPITNSKNNIIFNHLLAFAYAILNKLPDAEKHCNNCIAVESYPLDFYFILTYVHLSLREYEKVLKYSKKFSLMSNKMNASELNYSYTTNHRCQMSNFVGSAHLELRNNKKAITAFLKAIKEDAQNHLPYLNLISLYTRDKELTQAKKVLQKGLKKCSQIQELKLLEKSLTVKPTISACMIVKNEEELLGECLASIRDWVDEIIIVDTGSDDKTIEIAKSYGAKIYKQKWEGNFSKHRNFSLSKATSDWVFIIDADERMVSDDVPVLLQTLQNINYSIISINVFNVYGKREQTTTFLPSVRFWRRDLDLQYEGIVHNLLNLGMEHPVVRVNVRLKHLGYDLSPEKMHKKYLRTKTLLEDQLKETPDNAFALYNYAQILKSDRSKGDNYPLHNNKLILESARKAVQLTTPNKKNERHIHLMCLDQVAWAYFHDKNYDKSLEFAHQALNYKENYLDPLLLVGHIYAQQQIWEKAKFAYKTYLEKQAAYSPETETDPLILSHIDDRASVNYSLGLIAEREHDSNLAKSYYLKSLSVDAGFIETNSRLAQIFYKENDLENAKKYFTQQIELSITTFETLLGLASIYNFEGDTTNAEKYYNKTISFDKFNIPAKLQYFSFLLKTNMITKADKLVQAILKSKSDNQILLEIGNRYFEFSLFEQAALYYKKIQVPSAEVLNNLGNCYYKLKNYHKAEKYYSQSLQFENFPSNTLRNIGITRVKLGKAEQAIIDFRSYLQTNSQDFQIIAVLAETYKNTQNYELALHQYEILLQVEPNNISILYALSECYLLMGHKDSAIVGFQRIISLSPNFQPAQEQLNNFKRPILNN